MVKLFRLFFGLFFLVMIWALGILMGVVLVLLLVDKERREEVMAKLRESQKWALGQYEASKPKLSQAVEQGRAATLSGLDKTKEAVDKAAEALQTQLKEKPKPSG